MLGLLVNIRRCYRITGSLILVGSFVALPLNAVQYWKEVNQTPKNFEHDWIFRYFNSIDEDTEIGEIVDFLVIARTALVARGYECPTLMELAIRMKEYLIEQDIEINEEEIQQLYEEIYRREQLHTPTSFSFASNDLSKLPIELCKHKHKDKDKTKKKKEVKMKSKGIFGFLKCLAGGLICIIPIPAVQAVGAGLVLNGINDIVDDAREQGDENERVQQMDEQRRQEAAMLGQH